MYHKLISNLGQRAIRTLGWSVTTRMWMAFVMRLPQIIRKRNLYPIDKAMSSLSEIPINGRFGVFTINPSAIDRMIVEGSSAFSAIRELYVKDCYLRYHQIDATQIKTMVDLGANRGMVSAMFTPIADKIVAIEAQDKYNPVINDVLAVQNKFTNFQIGNYFVGSHEFCLPSEHKVSFAFIQEHYKLDTIDFLKMDIEGSEFDIIEELPFEIIKYISMEVHRDCGDPAVIGKTLSNHNFGYIMTDSTFRKTNAFGEVDYIYAWNKTLVNPRDNVGVS
jgi:hypothetical protein